MSNLQEIIDEESLNALGATMLIFYRKRGLNETNIVEFSKKITAEFAPDEAEKNTYPLGKSIWLEVHWALEQGRPSFAALYAHGEEDNLRKLIRTIVCGEILNVMQDQLETVLEVYKNS